MSEESLYNIVNNSLYIIIPVILLPVLMKVFWDEFFKKGEDEDKEFNELIRRKTLLFQKYKKGRQKMSKKNGTSAPPPQK